ncbi:hypothetical protein AAC03nite_01240 [Alicyclobacillus acidoterrestris]|uniref:hypothetical protein n=1 Tax=Alicyclobacillus suci TaxID=2816080 RepID=UPI00119752BA|nr:hypothetical protein [Alicyclobacillus suci]GEO24339.1 hypothetical protein AAC03nite_01240 [Alicyclobacillus acidoterrestris]
MATLRQIVDYLESSDYRSQAGHLAQDPMFSELKQLAKKQRQPEYSAEVRQEAVDEC